MGSGPWHRAWRTRVRHITLSTLLINLAALAAEAVYNAVPNYFFYVGFRGFASVIDVCDFTAQFILLLSARSELKEFIDSCQNGLKPNMFISYG